MTRHRPVADIRWNHAATRRRPVLSGISATPAARARCFAHWRIALIGWVMGVGGNGLGSSAVVCRAIRETPGSAADEVLARDNCHPDAASRRP